MSSITLRWKEKNLERTLNEDCFDGKNIPILTKGTILYYEDRVTKGCTVSGFYEIDQVQIQIVNYGESWSLNYKVDLKSSNIRMIDLKESK